MRTLVAARGLREAYGCHQFFGHEYYAFHFDFNGIIFFVIFVNWVVCLLFLTAHEELGDVVVIRSLPLGLVVVGDAANYFLELLVKVIVDAVLLLQH